MPTRPLVRVLLLALVPAAVVYVLAIALSAAAGIPSELVIRDLAQSCNTPMGHGLISSLGYLLWTAAAAIALFGALAPRNGVRGRDRQLLLCGGAFSLLLCLDDMLLLHDRYIGSTFLYGLYAVFALAILFRFRSQVVKLGGGTFLLAVVLLGLSVIIDKTQEQIPIPYDSLQLIEEGAKFLGIATWLAFWVQAAARAALPKADA